MRYVAMQVKVRAVGQTRLLVSRAMLSLGAVQRLLCCQVKHNCGSQPR